MLPPGLNSALQFDQKYRFRFGIYLICVNANIALDFHQGAVGSFCDYLS